MNAIQLQAQWDPRPGYAPTPQELAQHKARMACHVWRHPKLVSVHVDTPSPGPTEVVARVRAVGVCGTDTHCVETDDQGYMLFSGPARFPCVPGHEWAGEIVALGQAVRHLNVGDLIAAEGMLYCGLCEPCRAGRPNQCVDLDMVGLSSPGAFCDYITVDQKHCWTLNRLADRLGDAGRTCELGAIIEPIGCSYNGIYVAGPGMLPGSHVAIFGAGPIGLGAVALTRAAGAATITTFDIEPRRLQVALAMGADSALDPVALAAAGSSAAEQLLERTHGRGCDLIVEAAGAATVTMPQIERALAPGATVVYLGRTGERAPVLLDTLVSSAARIVGARGHAGGGVYPNIIRLLEHDRIAVDAMITARLGLGSARAAVERSRSRTDGKIMLLAER